MRLSSLFVRTGVLLVLVAPSAAAQSRLSTELFIARNGVLAPGSSLYGIGLTLSGGALGLRASTAAAFSSESTDRGESIGIDAWTGEVDLLLQPSILGGVGDRVALAPYVFGGIGRISQTDFDGFRQVWTGASYGAGVAVPLGRALGVTAEGRYRLPLAEALDENGETFESSFPRGWEYRFGVSITLGG
ncbi:MAG: hypothetical protein ABR499_22545 [Gemmatimonadaceae bacterium]